MNPRRTRVPKEPTFAKMVFRTPADLADEAAGLLVAHGALGCAVAELSRPGAMERKVVTLEAFFARARPADVARVGRLMRAAGMINGRARGRLATITDPGWATMWQRRFAPLRVGRRILIVPPWDRRREPRRISIVIQPGQAFGTGHHPSTAGVLRVLDALMSDARAPRRGALDVGTGSGVLALAMKLMGAERIVAIDVDEVALDNARDNAELNGLSRKIRFSAIPLGSVRGKFDLITANILSTVLIEMAPELVRRLALGGTLILGGILSREAPAVTRRFRKLLRPVDAKHNRGWATLVFEQ
jgi:ribosomal protein L11 methyltransferase